ncbi:DUF1428 domain-containing protein [Amaricoccus sp.]|uniref:DUF1428 domain-containing protein n=1 Tax=Amaricoccus sp. TaxID=1872485 RepID=UPI001B75288E|nr:DUF1428 domain-containing protein [Amaricoccus sp.]MBP7002116.1 DUF1428 domain-containing protein [Amaricoccus sp.]
MSYVDGFVCPVPLANKEAYRAHAAKAAEMFKEYGALHVMEAWADDVPEGEVTSFTMSVKRKDDEAVVFSWVVWPDKDARNQGWEKMMKDDRMSMDGMPFDGKRMIYGGFAPIVDV